MMPLIDKDALMEDIEATVRFSVRGYDTASSVARGVQMVLDRIKAAPTVDLLNTVEGKVLFRDAYMQGKFDAVMDTAHHAEKLLRSKDLWWYTPKSYGEERVEDE